MIDQNLDYIKDLLKIINNDVFISLRRFQNKLVNDTSNNSPRFKIEVQHL
ncbi:hypothetical protein HMPREF9103_01391, partial [Lentilactobacillus parafarraginis F0439]